MKTEGKIQQEMVLYFRNTIQTKKEGVVFSVPNESWAKMGVLKWTIYKSLLLTGLLPGASDLIVLQKGKCMFVEVKTPKGIQSDKQKKFQKNVQNLGFEYHLVRSLEDFKSIL